MLASSVTERMCIDLCSQQSNMFIDVQFSYLCFSRWCTATYLWLELIIHDRTNKALSKCLGKN